MILFYKKDTGNIFSVIDGRVHQETHLQCRISDGTPEENIGKYVIGWIENKNGRVECNMNKFELLQEFEDITPTSPLDYRIENGEIVKKELSIREKSIIV